jgi:hypothetical protein
MSIFFMFNLIPSRHEIILWLYPAMIEALRPTGPIIVFDEEES